MLLTELFSVLCKKESAPLVEAASHGIIDSEGSVTRMLDAPAGAMEKIAVITVIPPAAGAPANHSLEFFQSVANADSDDPVTYRVSNILQLLQNPNRAYSS